MGRTNASTFRSLHRWKTTMAWFSRSTSNRKALDCNWRRPHSICRAAAALSNAMVLSCILVAPSRAEDVGVAPNSSMPAASTKVADEAGVNDKSTTRLVAHLPNTWRQAASQSAPPATPASRALPSPIENPPFPLTDWVVNNTQPIGENWDVAPGDLQHALFGKSLDNTHYRLVGWLDAGMTFSNSTNSTLPTTYDLVPNHPEIDQLVLEFQKMPDTVQKRYVDWGFMSAHLVGIDYRFTAAKGWLDNQLLKHNNLYGYDPVLQYFEVYFPKIADGAVLQAGRYISPIDIESQLSNQNYLFSHSLMFGIDPYTYTGINMQVRVNKEFMYLVGVHSGQENVVWSGLTHPNAELLIGWNSADNKDAVWLGPDSLGSGRTQKNHDNEQIFNIVWSHKFNDRFHMQNQAYYMWEYGALKGGTAINGPAQPFAGSGAGPVIPGKSEAIGFVCNLEYKVNKKDYITVRPGFLNDPQGWRTGYGNKYTDVTIGYSHLITQNIWIRPEVRYDHAYTNAAFDNGTRKEQYELAGDIIFRF